MCAFDRRFDGVDKLAISHGIGFIKLIQSGFKILVVACAQLGAYFDCQSILPECILNTAAGSGKPRRQAVNSWTTRGDFVRWGTRSFFMECWRVMIKSNILT